MTIRKKPALHRIRPLYRITTHSLRHYAITKFAKATNGNVVLTSRFARHASPIITMRHIAKDNIQLYSEIENAFLEDRINKLKKLSNAVHV
jgi:integrase